MNYNPDLLDCAPAPIAEAWSWVTDRHSNQLIDLCQAVPAYLPPQSLRDHLAGIIQQGDGSTYTDIRGILPLRTALAEDINNCYNGNCEADDVIITAGCNQAFCSVIDTLCQKGDAVILPLPCYFNHHMWLSIRGIQAQYLGFNAETAQPSVSDAAKLVTPQTRAIVLVTPNNPTGAIYTPDCIQQFYEFARDYQLTLILDETYRDFIVPQTSPHPLFQHNDWRKHFIHLYSFSKVYSLTGYRTGAVVAGADLITQLQKIQDCTTISAPHVGQLAALYGLRNLSAWKHEKADALQHRATALKAAFSHPDLNYRLICAGAYFAYIAHPFKLDSRAVVKKLIEAFDLVSLPGSYFGPQQEPFIRFAFANLEEQYFPDVVERLIRSQRSSGT